MLNEKLTNLLDQFDTGLLGKMELLMKELTTLKFYYLVKKNVLDVKSYNDVMFKQYNGGITVLVFLNKEEAIDYNYVKDYEIIEISFYEICCKFCDDYNYESLLST